MYCILISGVPAAGKSTLAGRLADDLHISLISKDLVKELLFDRIGFSSRNEKVQLGTASMDILCYVADQLMKSGVPFILENNFEYASKDSMSALLGRYSAHSLLITLTGDYETIYKRFVQRNLSPDRHRGHVVNDRYPEVIPKNNDDILRETISLEAFVSGIRSRGFDQHLVGDRQIIVDTTDFRNVDYEGLLQEIINWISELHLQNT